MKPLSSGSEAVPHSSLYDFGPEEVKTAYVVSCRLLWEGRREYGAYARDGIIPPARAVLRLAGQAAAVDILRAVLVSRCIGVPEVEVSS